MNPIEKSFLGPEFMTWLYFYLFEEGFELQLKEAFPEGAAPEGNIVRFAIGKKVKLTAQDTGGPAATVDGSGLDNNGEVLQAVRRGALIKLLALDMAVGNRVYSFTLDGSDAGFSGMKLPDLFTDPNEDEAKDAVTGDKKLRRPKLPFDAVLELRMMCIAEAENVVDALFERFLHRRTGRTWQTDDMAMIRRVISRGLEARLLSTT